MKYGRLLIILGLMGFVFSACNMRQETAGLPTVADTAEIPVTIVTMQVLATETPTLMDATTLPSTNTPQPTATTRPTNTMTSTPIITATKEVTITNPPAATAVPPSSTPAPVVTNTPVPPASTVPPTIGPTSEVSLPPPPVGASPPQIYETTISIPTYGYEAGFIPTNPDDEIYPYPRLDFSQVSPPSSRSYQAVVLENGFVSLTILPELGGRIYRWVDKSTGRQLLYNNPVVKPTSWGFKGWWLGAGGIEWSFPVDEHGFNEWRPWTYTTGSGPAGLSVTVSDVDDHTGMEVGATISLDTGHAYVTIQPWVKNNTGQPQDYQLWLNAMLTLGGNSVSRQTQFIIPASDVIVHSTGDGGVPPSGGTMSWPFSGGRDMSWYNSWTGYLGFFAPGVSHGFTGIYDHAADQGMVRSYSPGWPAGTKIFGPATLSPSLWTDDNSDYVELWSGATGSFWSYTTIEPGASFSWTEYWYPVHGLGGFNYANRAVALRLTDNDSSVEIGAAVSGGITGRLVLYVGGQEMETWSLTIYPGQALRTTWTRPSSASGAPGLRLIAEDGTVMAQTGQVP